MELVVAILAMLDFKLVAKGREAKEDLNGGQFRLQFQLPLAYA